MDAIITGFVDRLLVPFIESGGAFLVFAIMAMLVAFSDGAAWAMTAAGLLSLWIPLYFFVAQKRVYGQGWLKTAVKALILAWLYGGLLLGLGLVLALLLAAVGG